MAITVTVPFEEFGIMARKAREAAGLTQKELAKKIGYANHTLCMMEKGKEPTLSLARAVAEAVGIKISWSIEMEDHHFMRYKETKA